MSLAGKRIIVTRASSEGGLSDALEGLGATVLHVPTIQIVPADAGPLDAALDEVRSGAVDVIAFTSSNGVDGLLGRAADPVAALSGTRVAAVGSTTARRLEALGVGVDLVPDTYTGEALARALGPGPGRVLLPRAEEVPPTMTDILRKAGWETLEVVAYRTNPVVPQGPDADAVRAGDFDICTFTSASTVAGFCSAFGSDALAGRAVACIGPVTAEAAEQAGLEVTAVAREHTIQGLVDALLESVGR